MKRSDFRNIIREEIKSVLNEEMEDIWPEEVQAYDMDVVFKKAKVWRNGK